MNETDEPTPPEAVAALASIGDMTRVGLARGLHSRRFAVAASLWVGAMAVATAYDGPAASRAIGALLIGGIIGLALWRRRIIARVRSVHGTAGTVVACTVIVGVLAIGLLGARAFEVHHLSWVPLGSGAAVGAVVFLMLEFSRRRTYAKLTAGKA